MTFDTEAITFRLKRLLGTLISAKNSEKELISIIKVLQQLNKEKNSALKSLFFETAEETNVEKKQKIQRLQAIDIEKALFDLKNDLFVMLENQEPKEIITIAKFFQSLKISEKEVRAKLNEFA
jgi:Fic family protein